MKQDSGGSFRVQLGDGSSHLSEDMSRLVMLMEKYSELSKSVDPEERKRGLEMINEEGKECSWHIQDGSQVVDALSSVWNQLTAFARSINLESLDDEEDDGGMEQKEYEQMVEYFKSGKIPYGNYKDAFNANSKWPKKCAPFSLAGDRLTLKKGEAIMLKKGEVMETLRSFHQICGHRRVEEAAEYLGKMVCFASVRQKFHHLLATCSCGNSAEIRSKDIQVRIVNDAVGGRKMVFSYGNISTEGSANLRKTNLEAKPVFSLDESTYQKELRQVRSSNSSKFRIASDERTLLTKSGAIVLKDDEAMKVYMRIHEMCGHPSHKEMESLLSRVLFVQRRQALCKTLSKKCNFCRCKNKVNLVSSSPVIFKNVNLDIKVHYDDGAVERRFEITAHGVDSKEVDNYVKSTIETLKKFGRWKEPVFSPEGALARSVLRVVDLLREDEKEKTESENHHEFDPMDNASISIEKASNDDVMEDEENEWSDDEMEAIDDRGHVDGEMSGEEGEEAMIEGEEESDIEDDETREMRRQIAQNNRDAEVMEKRAARLADVTGRMYAYIRQWEWSEYLQELLMREENPEYGRIEEENEEERDVDEWSEGEKREEEETERNEEGKESDKENVVESDEGPSTSAVGQARDDEKMRKKKKKKRSGKKNKKGKGQLEQPPFDLPPYMPNYVEKKDAFPDTRNTVQMERVEMEKREKKKGMTGPSAQSMYERKRGRLAQMRREKEELEKKTKKEQIKVVPVYNPYAVVFDGNMYDSETMARIQARREERELRKELGLTDSEFDEEESEDEKEKEEK